MGAQALRLKGIGKERVQGGARFRLEVPAFVLRRGERHALVGESGTGKSTLLDLLALVLAPEAGGGFGLEGEAGTVDLAALWRTGDQDGLAALRRRHYGYVLQTGGLLPYLNVADNLGLPARLLSRTDDARVRSLAQALDIASQLAKMPAALSVGQRQRVAVGRALVHRPAFILADEPTASLDPVNAEQVMRLLIAQAGECQAGLLVATHDAALAARLGLPILRLVAERRGADIVARLEA
ncbi:MAG: ABC transporter ATP-binding protein [Gammaproteobacteria bacterium]|nr:ABC transporter ATP-binding protein [Gammaproteobacteria bacterium]